MVAIEKNPMSKCYAVMWSYGYVCVGCGCCKRSAYKERLKYHQEQLKDAQTFDRWFEDVAGRALQEKNMKSNIAYETKKIRALKAKIRALKESN